MDEKWIHHYTTRGSQLSGRQRVKTVQSDQKRECQLVRLPPCFGMGAVFYSSITTRKEEPLIMNIIWRYWCVWRKKLWKSDHKWIRKKCFFTKTMHHVTIRSQQWSIEEETAMVPRETRQSYFPAWQCSAACSKTGLDTLGNIKTGATVLSRLPFAPIDETRPGSSELSLSWRSQNIHQFVDRPKSRIVFSRWYSKISRNMKKNSD